MSQQRAQSRPGTIGPSLLPRVANPIARNAGVFFCDESCLFIFVLNAVAAIFDFFIKVDLGELKMAPNTSTLLEFSMAWQHKYLETDIQEAEENASNVGYHSCHISTANMKS